MTLNPKKKARVVHVNKEPYDVYIGRPSDLGNPFSWKRGTLATFQVATRQEAIERHKAWVLAQPELIERIKRELAGKTLGCWCSPSTCHGDIYVKIANGERLQEPEQQALF